MIHLDKGDQKRQQRADDNRIKTANDEKGICVCVRSNIGPDTCL